MTRIFYLVILCSTTLDLTNYLSPIFTEGSEDEEEDDKDEEEEGADEDRRRRLVKTNKHKKKKRTSVKAAAAITRKLAKNKEYIDCEQCSAYECFVDEDDMDDGQQRKDELDEEVSKWIEELAQCQETGQQWNGLDLYTGVMCSPYGDGVELAVFANEDCTWYTNQAVSSTKYSNTSFYFS